MRGIGSPRVRPHSRPYRERERWVKEPGLFVTQYGGLTFDENRV
jgi:hypothetical protein